MSRPEDQARYPTLSQLFGAYFHEDWQDFHSDWQSVVKEFAKYYSPESGTRELDQIIQSKMIEAEIEDLLDHGFSAGILPRVIGLGNREWLQQLRDELQGASRAIRQPPASRA
jgi:CdiI immunity protein